MRYELTNHLGNVLSVVSDELAPNGEAQVISAKDYYPFGMSMPSRTTEGGTYRYGFNGQERDTETDLNDFGARFYAANLGRWLSIDPLAAKFPNWSPYNAMNDNPMFFIDPDGMDISPSNLNKTHNKALFQFMQTKEGWNFVAQFAKKGEKIKFDFGDGTKPFELTFQSQGNRSNDLLVLSTFEGGRAVSSAGYAAGSTQIYEGKDYKYDKPLANANEETDISKGLTVVIQLSSFETTDGATSTLGHEVFVHAEPALNKVQQIERSTKLKPGNFDYINKLKQVVKGDTDHDELAKDRVTKYKEYSKLLDKMRNDNKNYFIKKYEADVKAHKKN